jgi:hypothetical protein
MKSIGLGKLYQIKSLAVKSFANLIARRASFSNHQILRCTPCGSDINIEDVHSFGPLPLATEKFGSPALQLGVDTFDYHAVPTND